MLPYRRLFVGFLFGSVNRCVAAAGFLCQNLLMPRGPKRSTAPPPAPPANAAEGAARVRGLVMKLFDRQDGDGANWRLCAESLFRVAFELLTGCLTIKKKRSLPASMPGPMTEFLETLTAILRQVKPGRAKGGLHPRILLI